MTGGYMGKILFVNLTTSEIFEETLEFAVIFSGALEWVPISFSTAS
jgi:aldehyde:ferredoxin oxidoreductase